MKKSDLIIAEKVIENQISLLRFTAGERKKVLAVLDQLQKELQVKLLGDLTDFGKARVNKLLSDSTAIIEAAYEKMTPVDNVLVFHGSRVGDITAFDKVAYFTDSQQYASVFAGKQRLWEMAGKADPKIYQSYIKASEIIDFSGIGTKRISANTVKKLFSDAGLSLSFGADSYARKPLWKWLRGIRSEQLLETLGTKAIKMIEGNKDAGIDTVTSYITTPGSLVKGGLNPQSTDLLGLARHEAQATASTFAAIGLEASLPTEAVLKALVNGSLIEGAPSSAWWAKQSDDLSFRFANQVRQGIMQGETLQQIIIRIAGSKKLGTPGIMDISRRNASALVHTSIQQVANDARLATFKANEDIIKGVRQVSTLDGHTSTVCIAYSGACWDLDGKPIMGTKLAFNGGTPRHFNCRSVLVPITKTYRELGVDIDEVPTGTRASDQGQIKSDITFSEFLKGKDNAYVDNLLGKGRAELWRNGKITLQDLLAQNGRPLTLEQLRNL